METFKGFAVAALVVIALMFWAPLSGALFGGFAGWVVGLFWTDPIVDFLHRLGVDVAGLTVWQIGVAMGFLGGFLKTTVSSTKSND